jgi:aryl-alcohol dehydrogenase-like predicted oxidoreductase
MTFGRPVGEKDSINLVHKAIDLGINFIDTANVYEGYDRVLVSAGGVAESILGKALKGRRAEVVVATKVGSPLGSGPQEVGLTATHIHRELDASLRRLQTDYIDLYIIHWPDISTPLETTLSAMDVAVKQGKVRCFGTSNHWAADLCKLLWLADKYGWPRAVSSQIPYSLLRREYQNDLEFCARHDIGVTPYQSLQGGLLTGKYRRGESPPADSRAAQKPAWIWEPDEAIFHKLEATEALSRELGVPMAQYALAWTLTQPAMASLVVGVTSEAQVADAVAAADVDIPQEISERQDAICPPPWANVPPFGRA